MCFVNFIPFWKRWFYHRLFSIDALSRADDVKRWVGPWRHQLIVYYRIESGVTFKSHRLLSDIRGVFWSLYHVYHCFSILFLLPWWSSKKYYIITRSISRKERHFAGNINTNNNFYVSDFLQVLERRECIIENNWWMVKAKDSTKNS